MIITLIIISIFFIFLSGVRCRRRNTRLGKEMVRIIMIIMNGLIMYLAVLETKGRTVILKDMDGRE